jgi:SAM-dependent methyltransferase
MPETALPESGPKPEARFRLSHDRGLCRLCGTGEDQRTVGPESYARSGQQLRRCGRCAAVYLAPDFEPAAFKAFYSEQYRRLFPSETIWLSEKRFFAWRGDRTVARRRLARIAPLLSPGTRLFEVGSGFGAFLEAAAESGLKGLQASEPDIAHRSRLLGGIDVTFHDRLSALPTGSVDVVVAFHVLEHLQDPLAFMAELLAALKPGGHAFIEVPDLMNGLLSTDHVHPAHLTYFTRETLTRLAQAAGLRVLFCGGHPEGGLLADNLWLELERPVNPPERQAVAVAPSAEIAQVDAWLGFVDWDGALRWNWRRRAKAAALRVLGPGAVGEWQRWRQWRRLRRAGWGVNHDVP